ncbi:otoancorin [Rhinophrynus dorsalis]
MYHPTAHMTQSPSTYSYLIKYYPPHSISGLSKFSPQGPPISQDVRISLITYRMDIEMKLCLLLVSFSQLQFAAAQNAPVPDLPPQLLEGLKEIISGDYLNGLLDILQFQSFNSNGWTPDLVMEIITYLSAQNGLSIGNLQSSVIKYLESLSEDPQLLLSELRRLDTQKFQLAMKYLLGGKKEEFDMADVVLDFDTIRETIFQSPGGNRTLFVVTMEKCLPNLNSAECVDILSQVIRMYGGTYLQADVIKNLPLDIPEDPFRNLSSVFRDLYDKITANARRALYEWMTQILQKSFMANEVNGSTSWVTAENLWILGRYMVLLPLEEIRKISVNEIRMFISYDNATKQLDTVYDITPDLAQAFLELINSSGFDMRNISTIYRLGLLVCFYDDVQDLDPAVAKALLHQMIKCNQLRGFHSEVQKLKSKFLHIAILNQTLNESLGSLSDAVVGLTLSQLESLSPEAVQGAILTLQQVSGWTKSQIMVLAGKYLHSEKVLTFSNISQLGELVSGIGAQSFYDMNPREILLAMKSGLSQHATGLSPAQQEGILSKMLSSGEFQTVMLDMNGVFFKEVPLSYLLTQSNVDATVIKEKEMRRSQALVLYALLSQKTSLVDLLSTGQLVKGITCEQIDGMSKPIFLNHYKLLEKSLLLLSPYQIHCLAWKYWKISQSTIPPFLLAVLPSEYFASYPIPCGPLLISLGKTDLNYLVLNTRKKEMIINKVHQCLNGSLANVSQLDMLGSLICHLSPSIIQKGIPTDLIGTTINQLKACTNLTYDQQNEIKTRLVEHYGHPLNWTSETVQDMAPFWNLLTREEFTGVLIKFQNTVLQMISDTAGIPLTEGMLSVIFDAVRSLGANVSAFDQTAECADVIAPSDDDIVRLAEANCFWSYAELQCINSDTFIKTVHLLGAVRCFNQSQLSVLKEKAKQVWGELWAWKSYHIASLGRIALALSEQEIQELDLNSIDSVSSLSEQVEWTSAQAKSILHGYLNDSAKSLSELQSYELAGLGECLCAADPEQVDLIQTSEFRAVISRIGSLPCKRDILQAFKKKAEMVYGNLDQWNRSILNDIGYIAVGLNKEDLKGLDPSLMAYIQPAAIKYIPGDIFKELSPEQIANLGPENGAMVTDSQRAQLNNLQLQSLSLAQDGIRANIPESEPVTTPTTTKASTSPVSESSVLTSGYCILTTSILLFICS